MIGKLTGVIDEIHKDYIIMDVGGVGYLIYCSNFSINRLSLKSKSSLIIETYVREDQISLFGFTNVTEREWFRKFVTVKGVGNKLALMILSCISMENLPDIFLSNDKKMLSSVPGVGPRLSERIISELKNSDIILNTQQERNFAQNISEKENNIIADTISALSNLGYARSEAYNIVSKLLQQESDITINNLIKKALKELAK